jgi:ribosome-associated translation inhibitor RaiA
MALQWNVVNRMDEPMGAIEHKIRDKIPKLETLLAPFRPEGAHLQIVMDPNLNKKLYRAALTLRLPSHTLHAESVSKHLVEAVDDSVLILERQVTKLKAMLRQEPAWRRLAQRPWLSMQRAALAEIPSKGG